MTVTISRLYEDYGAAARAVRDLEAAGLSHSDISLVSNNSNGWYKNQSTLNGAERVPGDDRPTNAATGAGVGATVGGAAGLLAGLGLLAIPGVGPVVAAGWLVATIAGVAAGGATGGVIGALIKSGVSREDANVYAEGIRRGGTLVSARILDGDRTRYEAILDRSAVDTIERGASYRTTGWSGFDEAAGPYLASSTTPDIRASR